MGAAVTAVILAGAAADRNETKPWRHGRGTGPWPWRGYRPHIDSDRSHSCPASWASSASGLAVAGLRLA